MVSPELKDIIALRVDAVFIPVIGNIDINNNTFDIKVDIDVSWAATAEDKEKAKEKSRKYKPTFVPDLVFMNSLAVGVEKLVPLEADSEYLFLPTERNSIRQRFIGTMVNEYDVGSFPFDVQHLIIAVSISFFPQSMVYFEPRSDGKPFVYVPTTYTAVPGFELSRAFGFVTSDSDFSVLVAAVQVKRIPGPYFFRIFLPLLALNAATFSMYAVDSIEAKINNLITTLLSFVGMIYILSSLVPMCGKSNVFDRYAMSSVMLCVMSIFISGWDKTSDLSIYIHGGLCAALHVYVCISMGWQALKSREKLKSSDLETVTNNIYEKKVLTYVFPKKKKD